MGIRFFILMIFVCLCGCQPAATESRRTASPQSKHVRRYDLPTGVLFVLDSDAFLHPVTGRLQMGAVRELDPVIRFAREHVQDIIRIRAYGGHGRVQADERELLAFQAESLAAYMWYRGLRPNRLIYGEGVTHDNSLRVQPALEASRRFVTIRFCPV